MTAAPSADFSMEIEAGGRAVASPGAGQSQAAGHEAWSAAQGSSRSSVSETESFRSRWQATLTASGLEPATAIDAEGADKDAGAGEGMGAVPQTSLLNSAKGNSAAALEDPVAEQTNKTAEQASKALLTAARPAASSRRLISGEGAAALQAESVTGEGAGEARARRSAQSDRRRNDLKQNDLKQVDAAEQPATGSAGTLALAAPAPVIPAPVIPPQIQAANLSGGTRLTGSMTGGYRENSEAGVLTIASAETSGSPAASQTGLPGTPEGQAAATELEQASSPSPRSTGDGRPLVEPSHANSGTYRQTNLPAAEGAAEAAQSQAATVSERTYFDSGRPAHRETADGTAAQPATFAVLAQTPTAGAEASVLARISASVEGTASPAVGHAGVPAGSTADATAQGTFSAIDRGTGVGTPSWVHAGGQTAEAGFQDPALGWVGVRADMSGGGVHASLLPGSAEAAQTLGGHLAGLNAYLADEHTPVATLTLAAAGGGGAETGLGQNMQHGSDPNAEQSAPAQTQSSAQASTELGAARATETGSSGLDAPALLGEMRGRYVSVMA